MLTLQQMPMVNSLLLGAATAAYPLSTANDSPSRRFGDSRHWGFVPIIIKARVLAASAVAIFASIDGDLRQRIRARPAGTGHLPMRTWAKFAAPTAVFAAMAFTPGRAATFIPLAIPNSGIVSVFLMSIFTLSLMMVTGRMFAGRIGDHLTAGRLLQPGAVLSGADMVGIALTLGTEAGVRSTPPKRAGHVVGRRSCAPAHSLTTHVQ